MRGKVWVAVALGLMLGSAALVGTLTAQEKPDDGSRVRVMSLAQGSYLGVFISDVSAEDAQRLDLREERGVLISGVADEGPARDAGLQEDDVILSWNGQRVESEAQLRRLLSETPAGRRVSLGVFREGSERSISVELGSRDGFGRAFSFRGDWDDDRVLELRRQLEKSRDHLDDLQVRVRGMPRVMSFMMRGGRLGVGIQSLGPQLGEYFGLGDRTGVLITTVNEDSPAAAAGLRAGDVIIAVDGEEIDGPGDVSRLVWDAEAGPVAIRVLRDRAERTVTVELPEAENTWTSDDGEIHGLFFGPDGIDGDVHVEWADPFEFHFEGAPHILHLEEGGELEFPHIEVVPGDAGIIKVPDTRGPVRVTPGKRALSI